MSSVVLQIMPRVTGRSSVCQVRYTHTTPTYGRKCGRIFPEQRCHVSVTSPFSAGEMAVHKDEESHSVFASTASFSDPPDLSSQLCIAYMRCTEVHGYLRL